MGKFHACLASALLYHLARLLRSAQLFTTSWKYSHTPLPWKCTMKASGSGSEQLQTFSRVERRLAVGTKLLCKSISTVQRHVPRNKSFTVTNPVQESNGSQWCFVKGSKFSALKDKDLAKSCRKFDATSLEGISRSNLLTAPLLKTKISLFD